MKKLITKFLPPALLAVAGLMLATPAAHALNSYTESGELLLGFRQAGATSDYLIKLTLATSLPNSGSTTFSLGSVATDLTTAFGSNWYTATGASQVYWSVFGIDGVNGNGAIYTGRATSTPWGTLTAGVAGDAYSNIASVTGNYNNSQASTATGGYLEPVSNAFSYNSFQSGGTSFGVWNTSEAAITGNMYLNVMNLNSSGASTTTQVPGFFSINSSGDISYTVAAVPEPSTYASLALGAGAIAMVIRRRAVKA